MFFLMQLEHKIQLHPSYFGPFLTDYLHKQLKVEVEGQCTGTIVSGRGGRRAWIAEGSPDLFCPCPCRDTLSRLS